MIQFLVFSMLLTFLVRYLIVQYRDENKPKWKKRGAVVSFFARYIHADAKAVVRQRPRKMKKTDIDEEWRKFNE